MGGPTPDAPDDPRVLLGLARRLVAEPDQTMTGRWPRAAALLARQALEAEVAARCGVIDPSIAACDARGQLLCLPLAVDHDLARAAAHTWAALSHACHHQPYDLPPTAGELAALMEVVEQLVGAPRRGAAGGAQGRRAR